MVWDLKNLQMHCISTTTQIDGKWVPARPVNWELRTFRERLSDAWAVFIGTAEPFKWPEGQ